MKQQTKKGTKLFTKMRVTLFILMFLTLGVLLGVVFGNKPIEILASDSWLEFIEQATFTHEKLDVTSDGYKLEVELFIPEGGASKKPVVVFAGGSGHGIYQNYSNDFTQKLIIEYFHSYDFAVVLYNKRGMGESEGNWVFNDFDGRARDVGAIIDVVKTDDRIDPTNIGVLGHSQGGWIAPLVASVRDDVSFWISYAGPATSYIEQIEDMHETFYACDGLSEDEIASKMKLKLMITRIGAKIGKVIPIGDINFDAEVIDYDPATILQDLEVPGLFLFGENDPLVDPERNQDAMQRIYGDELPSHIRSYVIPSVHHSLRVAEDMCVSYGDSLQGQYTQEMYDELDAWMEYLGY